MIKQPGMTNAEYLRELRRRAAEQGLCYQCRFRPAKPGRRCCQDCIDRANEVQERLISERRCISCCCNLPRSNPQQRCPSCRAEESEATSAERERRAAAGICTMCGAAPGNRLCVNCKDRVRDQALLSHRLAGRRPKPCGICGQLGHNRRSHDRMMERAKEWQP